MCSKVDEPGAPRPHAVEHNEYYRKHVAGYMQRHAQARHHWPRTSKGWRGETAEAMARRIGADLRYQRNWSLKLDIKIDQNLPPYPLPQRVLKG